MSYSNTILYRLHPCGNRRGIILVELLTAIMIIASLTAVMVSAVAMYGRYNGILLARQRCIAAGQAQLDCIAATGKPIDEPTFTKLWPQVKCSVDSTVVSGAADLVQADIALTTVVRKKEVRIIMSRWFAAPIERSAQ